MSLLPSNNPTTAMPAVNFEEEHAYEECYGVTHHPPPSTDGGDSVNADGDLIDFEQHPPIDEDQIEGVHNMQPPWDDNLSEDSQDEIHLHISTPRGITAKEDLYSAAADQHGEGAGFGNLSEPLSPESEDGSLAAQSDMRSRLPLINQSLNDIDPPSFLVGNERDGEGDYNMIEDGQTKSKKRMLSAATKTGTGGSSSSKDPNPAEIPAAEPRPGVMSRKEYLTKTYAEADADQKGLKQHVKPDPKGRSRRQKGAVIGRVKECTWKVPYGVVAAKLFTDTDWTSVCTKRVKCEDGVHRPSWVRYAPNKESDGKTYPFSMFFHNASGHLTIAKGNIRTHDKMVAFENMVDAIGTRLGVSNEIIDEKMEQFIENTLKSVIFEK